ncbi:MULTISPECIES: ABC transporter ATP-binding protein [Bacillaceae]|uniref:ABC transporter ATP-binding protein n=1 Tax=Bacillaceae TaxID=186817 RepID=UPI000BFD17BD|nr:MULTISPECIES: ABC transporter ATP-binding protein [Bacillaceae]PGT81305.1 bacitracin ABC transporter ATP-binding protein [Bacillus sp. AFS040349]UGB32893.1 ABC transporter ATP-binding protein [Metabacillus sp. B2-18]
MSQLIVETNNLTKSFKGAQAVNSVNLNIPKGSIYGFLGPNGAGKTTAIKLLLGLMKETSGSIQIFGKDLKKDKQMILRRIGSLVESPSYYGHLTARENLQLLQTILHVPKERIDEVLAIVRLEKDDNRPVKGFSLGMKQRLGIASALLGNPELLILDEPTNGLDPSGIIEIRELIKSLPEKYGVTVLVSSHLLSEIDQMATEVGIISKGSLIFQDSIEVLRKKSVSKIRIQTNNSKAAWNILVKEGLKGEIEGNYLSFKQNKNKEVAEMIRILVQHKLDVYRVEEVKRSLESIFLDMTKEEKSL